jgi:hypothetical protein
VKLVKRKLESKARERDTPKLHWCFHLSEKEANREKRRGKEGNSFVSRRKIGFNV